MQKNKLFALISTTSFYLIILFLGYFLGASELLNTTNQKSPLDTPAADIKSVDHTPSPNSNPNQDGYFRFKNLPYSWNLITEYQNEYKLGDNVDLFYLPTEKPLTSPSILSEYDFVLIRTQFDATPAFVYTLTDFVYLKTTYFGTNQFSGNFYIDRKGDAWLQASIHPSAFGIKYKNINSCYDEYPSVLIAHADSNDAIEKMLEQLGEIEFVTVSLPAQTLQSNQIRNITQNSNKEYDKYRFYVPTNYNEVGLEDGFSAARFIDQNNQRLCMSLKEVEGHYPENCLFSTSGCTCCNTGCELIDFVLYTDSDNDLLIREILQKGSGNSSGARFVYGDSWENNIHGLYSASFSSDLSTEYEGVIDLIHMVNSLEMSQ